MNNIKRCCGLLIFAMFLPLFQVKPATAFGLPGGLPGLPSLPGGLPNEIEELFRDFQQVVGKIDTFLARQGLEVSKGKLGLPDISKAIELFENNNSVDIASDFFGTQTGSTITIKDKLTQQYLKDLGNQYSQNSALSTQGQEKISRKIESANKTVEASQKLADDSSGQDVSQNILRNISNQAALQQRLSSMILFELQEDKVSRALALSMQGESLAELARQTTRSERETNSLYKTSLYNHALMSVPGQHLVQ